MQPTLVSLALSGLGRDALKCAAGFALVVLLVSAFVLSMFLAVVQAIAGALLGGPVPADVAPFAASGASGVSGAASESRLRAATAARPATGSAVPAGPVQGAALALARSQLGRPYVWGGASPQSSFDCSGLVQWAYREAGASLPRTAQQQFDATVPVARDRLAPGDLVFFAGTYDTGDSREWITHVGLYVGDGRMVDANAAGVGASPVFTGYWGAHYAGAGRVPLGAGPAGPRRQTPGASGAGGR